MKHAGYFLTGMLIVLAFGCKEAYRPDVISSSQHYLVVEGVLNLSGPTTVRLTRSSKLDTTGYKPELNAQLTVEGRDNSTRSLTQSGNGDYISSNLNLILNNDYRLRIHTSDGKEYLSEYVTARQTPAIDSIGWKLNDDGLQFYANAHDATGNTRYYRWDYDETWEIKSFYYSNYIYINSSNTVRARTTGENVSAGWKYSSSGNIVLGSSARLQSDVIFQSPIAFIDKNNEKLSVRYSLLLKQYALDKKGFEFYELMKRNTENLGSIFDVQPSEVRGNIQCTSDPSELVIGYISASTISQKRIFVSDTELPYIWQYPEQCPPIRVANNPDSIKAAFQNGIYGPYDAVSSPAGALSHYLSSYINCVDVTKRGASLVRPSYW